MDKNVKVFHDYAYKFDQNKKWINYKYNHSLRVMELSGDIATSLKLGKKSTELVSFIGLTHDISRFKQWTMYETFDDSKSFDHGEESTNILFNEGLIEKFDVNKKHFKIMSSALKNHNKYEIDKNLSEEEILHSKIIRDADKLDILYAFGVLRVSELETDDTKISEEAKNNFFNKKQTKYEEVKTKNDRIIELISLVFDINFDYSIDIIKKKGYISSMYESIDNKEYFKEYFEFVNKYIDERIGNYVR